MIHAPVGLFRANAFGLHDVVGNVWEWCADGFDAGAYARYATGDTAPPASGKNRTMRGGSWLFDAAYGRSAYRGWNVPSNRLNNVGVRPARSLAD